MSRIRTLLVDDAAPLRRLMRLMFERHGAFDVVAEAANGEEGLAASRTFRPDLMLLDLSMPVLDGLETLARLREEAMRPVVVVISGFEEHRMADQALALGASEYIEKGLRPDELTSRVLSAYQRTLGFPTLFTNALPPGGNGLRHVRAAGAPHDAGDARPGLGAA